VGRETAESRVLTLDDLHDAILERVSIETDAKTIILAFIPIQFYGTR
jgi:hypothetical protein